MEAVSKTSASVWFEVLNTYHMHRRRDGAQP
jgi:hypothetical protein